VSCFIAYLLLEFGLLEGVSDELELRVLAKTRSGRTDEQVLDELAVATAEWREKET